MRELTLVQAGQSVERAVSRDVAPAAVERELQRLLAENAPLARANHPPIQDGTDPRDARRTDDPEHARHGSAER